MTLFLRYQLLFISMILLFSCKNSGYEIVSAKETVNKESPESYIEGMLVIDNRSQDTIWHFKFNIRTDDYYFKSDPAFNVGVSLKNQQGSGGSLNIIYQRVSQKEKLDSLTYTQTGGLSTFTNYNTTVGNAGFDRSVSMSSDDQRAEPITSGLLANTDDMKMFLQLFEKEIRQSLHKETKVKYISSASCNLNAATIEMIVVYN